MGRTLRILRKYHSESRSKNLNPAHYVCNQPETSPITQQKDEIMQRYTTIWVRKLLDTTWRAQEKLHLSTFPYESFRLALTMTFSFQSQPVCRSHKLFLPDLPERFMLKKTMSL